MQWGPNTLQKKSRNPEKRYDLHAGSNMGCWFAGLQQGLRDFWWTSYTISSDLLENSTIIHSQKKKVQKLSLRLYLFKR